MSILISSIAIFILLQIITGTICSRYCAILAAGKGYDPDYAALDGKLAGLFALILYAGLPSRILSGLLDDLHERNVRSSDTWRYRQAIRAADGQEKPASLPQIPLDTRLNLHKSRKGSYVGAGMTILVWLTLLAGLSYFQPHIARATDSSIAPSQSASQSLEKSNPCQLIIGPVQPTQEENLSSSIDDSVELHTINHPANCGCSDCMQ